MPKNGFLQAASRLQCNLYNAKIRTLLKLILIRKLLRGIPVAMKEKEEHISTTQPEDYLVAALIDYYRKPLVQRNYIHAAKVAQNILARNGTYQAGLLEKRFLFFASKLKDNVNPTTLRDFAEKCHASATKAGTCPSPDEKQNLSARALKKRVKEDLSLALKLGHSEGAAITRAAYELVKKKREEMARTRLSESIRRHPLRETLEGLMVKAGRLAKEDIRNQFLHLKRPSFSQNNGEGVLYGLLAKAQAFSAARLHRLMGDELFFLCRPTGFLDQKGTTIVVEVPTSAHLHALTYRKLEILRALKTDNAFLLVNKIHFKVKSTTF